MPGPDKMKALLAFLVKHFDSDDLEWVLQRLPDEGHLLAEIPSYQHLAPKKFAKKMIVQLSRRPSLQQPFFELLAEERPGVATEAATLARLWLPQPVVSEAAAVTNNQNPARRSVAIPRETVATQQSVPPWAVAAGIDNYGRWVRVEVGNATNKMRWIEPGSFLMGSPESETGRGDNEVQHRVELTKGFWLSDAPCTQAFWEAVTGANPSDFKGPERPVENVNWTEVMEFCLELQARRPGGEGSFRLPTEAEWEYACRAGTTAATYAGVYELDQIAWYENNSGMSTQPVRRRYPNAWGLYDMLGNVDEWCADRYGVYTAAAVNHRGPAEGSFRVFRGSSSSDQTSYLRAAFRGRDTSGLRDYTVGFRLARGPALGR